MISVITVYDSEQALEKNLLRSLKQQNDAHDFIPIDNTSGRFQSAASALNEAGKRATGNYLMFLHSDVVLCGTSWLNDVERELSRIPDLGVAGCAGMTTDGKVRGYMKDRGTLWGSPLEKAEEVQTLDECLLIVPRHVFDQVCFDETLFDGWHCYGADLCLTIKKELNLKSYAISAMIHHNSILASTRQSPRPYLRRLRRKHRSLPRIYTTIAPNGVSWQRLALIEPLEDGMTTVKRVVFPPPSAFVERHVRGCASILEVVSTERETIDRWEVQQALSRRAQGKHEYVCLPVDELASETASFDAVLAVEALDGLPGAESRRLLAAMERVARKRIVVLSRNMDPFRQSLQEPDGGGSLGLGDFRALGFQAYGLRGWRRLREKDGRIGRRPKPIWRLASALSQKLTYRLPRYAFAALYVKKARGRRAGLKR